MQRGAGGVACEVRIEGTVGVGRKVGRYEAYGSGRKYKRRCGAH